MRQMTRSEAIHRASQLFELAYELNDDPRAELYDQAAALAEQILAMVFTPEAAAYVREAVTDTGEHSDSDLWWYVSQAGKGGA